MNNIRKFEDFLDKMQGLIDNAKKQGHIIVPIEDIENTFPELKESEDERIRKDLIEYFRWNAQQILNDFDNKEVLAWLEKHGNKLKEEKVDNANKVEPKFKHGDRVRNKKSGLEQTLGSCIKDVYEGAFPFRIKDQDDWELVEHDTAWSEKDENNLTDTCVAIRKFYHGTNGAQELIDWLQVIKQRIKGE